MLGALGELGAMLALTTASFTEAVNETLLAYGVAVIANATDIRKLRALAKVEAWKVALTAAGGRIDWSEAGASFKQSQYRSAAEAGLKLVRFEAMEAGYIADPSQWDGGTITVGQMSTYDPYA